MTVYAIALSKGGSTKTTTAAEVVASWPAGRRVLAIDWTNKATSTTRLGVTDDTEVEAVAADVLTADASAVDAAVPAPSVPGADVLAGTHDLAELNQRPEVITSLRDHLPELVGEWDDVVIDTPPAMGLVTLAALAADVHRDRLRRLRNRGLRPARTPGRSDRQAHRPPHAPRSASRMDRPDALRPPPAPRSRRGRPAQRAVPPAESAAPSAKPWPPKTPTTDGKPVSVYAPGTGIAEDYHDASRQSWSARRAAPHRGARSSMTYQHTLTRQTTAHRTARTT